MSDGRLVVRPQNQADIGAGGSPAGTWSFDSTGSSVNEIENLPDCQGQCGADRGGAALEYAGVE